MPPKRSTSTTRRKTTTRAQSKPDVFDTLWSVLPHPSDSVVRLFTRGGNDRDGDFAQSAAEIRKFAKTYEDRNIYVAPNPTSATRGIRHTAEEVTHWSFFLIDMDPVEEKNDPKRALDKALLWLGEWVGRDFNWLRPVIIDSGRGVQAWFRLDDILLGGDLAPGGGMDRTVVRRVQGHWLKKLDEKLGTCHGCRIDTSVSDLPRVMRCPGTVNIKTGRTTSILDVGSGPLGGLAELLVTGTPKKALIDPPVTALRGLSWTAAWPHMTRMAQDYLLRGQEEPGRHKVCWHTAKKFQELGVERAQARAGLQWANSLKGADAELPSDQIEHALDTAYGELTKG